MSNTRWAPDPRAQGAAVEVSDPAGRLLTRLEWAVLLAALILGIGVALWPALLWAGAGLLAVSWLARWLRTSRLTRPTPLDLPLLVFAASTLIALWAAPSLPAALPRFYLFLAAGSVFYSLANASPRALRLAALGVVVSSALMAAAWLVLRPPASVLHRNDVAGLQAVGIPIAAALLVHYTRRWRASQASRAWNRAALAGASLLVMIPTPVLAGSRTVGLAAAAAMAVAAWWWLAGRLALVGQQRVTRPFAFWGGLGAGLLLAVAVLSPRPQWVVEAARTLPGQDPTTGLGRFVLYGEAWRLAQATPYTGGGLGAFPALFSTYMHDIPHFLLAHAHNVYLNLLVEQGWPGLAAYALALACAAWTAARALAQPPEANRSLLAAGAAGLVMVAVHGLGDATFVASWAAPFALVPAGLVVATAPDGSHDRRVSCRRRLGVAAVLLMAVFTTGALAHRPLAAAWQANLGALTLARAHLAGWPTGQWTVDQDSAAQAAARQRFEAALALQPGNAVAHFYLGLMARQRLDFEAAAAHLDRAFAADPDHRGVIKALGYTDVWLGRYEAARPLLARIPEAAQELKVYAGWWGQQGRADLAEKAAMMARLLTGVE